MEKAGEETGIITFQEYASSDFGILDNFMDNEANFDQLINLITEENAYNPIVNFTTSQVFDFDQQNSDVGGCLANDQILFPGNHQLFDFDNVATNHVAIISPDCSTVNEFTNDVEERDEEESSATTSNTTSEKQQRKKKSAKSDRARTLISERRRRGRMKEKLYALRSLVPNITKMDKASIVGDAVLYVQDLQMQAKKLKSEIAGLESSFIKAGDNAKLKSKKILNVTNFCPNPTIKKIFKMDVFQVEERGFYVRLVSKKGKGVAVFLFKALQSLTRFNVKSSNLATDAENYVFTFTLHIAEEVEMNLPSLKMWIKRAFLGQGFDFETSTSA